MKTTIEKRILSENVINELQSLVSEEFLAWEMYQLAIVSMKGRKQHLLEDVSKDNGEDEFNDHFKNLCMWMQSNGIKVVTSRKEMDNLSQCTSFDFSDGMSTEQIIDMLILSENEAISHYEDVLSIDEVKNDLNTMLCGFLKDEREHLKKLIDIKNEMEEHNMANVIGKDGSSSEEEMVDESSRIVVNESTSSLRIDYLIECAFDKDLNSDPANEVLRDNLNHYDFQDTDGDNQTECYFYFPKDIDEVTLEECKDRICDILGLQEYEFWESDAGDDSERRIDAICHIEI